MIRWLTGKKRKEEKEEIAQSRKLQQDSLEIAKDTAEQGKGHLDLAEKNTNLIEENVAVSKSLNQKSGQFIELIAKNDKDRIILLEREEILRKKEENLNKREDDIRIGEISIEARKSEVRQIESIAKRRESDVKRRDESLENERVNIKERERTARDIEKTSRNTVEKYEKRERQLDDKESNLIKMEEELSSKSRSLNEQEQRATQMSEEAARKRDELAGRESDFEEKRKDIERNLNEKIDEYDRKIAAIEEVKNTVNFVKFDGSEEGKSAKIVVQEAIRLARKSLEDEAGKFSELQDKYCQGTFRGFSIPIDEIDRDLDKLKSYRKQINEHAMACDIVGVEKIVEFIDTCLVNADTAKKSFEFPEAFYCICRGLVTCKNYELLLEIISNVGSPDEDDASEEDPDASEEEPDYYEILKIPKSASDEDILKAYRKMAQKFHPDRHLNNPDKKEEYERKMQEINQARDILLDKKKRDAYNKKHGQS